MLTTSPPGSVHLIGAAVKKATGAKWVADLRDSIALHAHRSSGGRRRAREAEGAGRASRISSRARPTRSSRPPRRSPRRRAGSRPRGRVVTIANGCDFDDFAGLEYTRGDRFRLTHAGSFFGKRDPKPFLQALADSGLDDVTVRFLGDFRPGDREFMESLGLGDRVELIDHVPRRESLRLQRDSDALLLLIPEAGGRGRGVLSGKVFEYLAAERPVLAVVPPDGAAAELDRATPAPGSSPRPTTSPAIRDALARAARALARRRARRHAALAGVAREALPRRARRGARRAPARASRERRRRSRSRVRAQLARRRASSSSRRSSASRSRSSTGISRARSISPTCRPSSSWSRSRDDAAALPRTTAILLGFFAAFLLVYLLGFFNLDTKQGVDQFSKGMVKFVLHFLFLAAGVSYLVQRGRRFYWRALGWFGAGIVANCVYGVLQLLSLGPVTISTRRCSRRSPAAPARSTSTARSRGTSVYRPNALTGDPNHLGIFLIVPLLTFLPVYLRLERGHPWKSGSPCARLHAPRPARELSRSGVLGLGIGLLVLALPYRRLIRARALLVPLAGVALVLAIVLW